MYTKNKMKIFLSIALIAFIMIGCSKDDDDNNDDNNNNNPPTAGFNAKIDGTTWTSTGSLATMENGTTTISGFSAKSTSITLSVNAVSAGTYTLGQTAQHIAILIDDSGTYSTNADASGSGEIVISDVNTSDSLISGTFHFEAYEIMQSGTKKTITEGSFTDVKFTSGNGGGGGSGNGTMQLDVDGNTWTPEATTAASALDMIALAGEDSDSEQYLSFLLPNTITTGTYDLPGEFTVLYVSTEGLPYFASSGTLEVTKHNTATNEFEGTFEFDGSDYAGGTVSITNGSFSVDYLEKKK